MQGVPRKGMYGWGDFRGTRGRRRSATAEAPPKVTSACESARWAGTCPPDKATDSSGAANSSPEPTDRSPKPRRKSRAATPSAIPDASSDVAAPVETDADPEPDTEPETDTVEPQAEGDDVTSIDDQPTARKATRQQATTAATAVPDTAPDVLRAAAVVDRTYRITGDMIITVESGGSVGENRTFLLKDVVFDNPRPDGQGVLVVTEREE